MSKLPKGWELVETGTVTIVGAGTGFKPDFQGFTDREIPFYKVSDMNLLGNEMFMTEANNYVDSEDLKVLKAKTFPKNTLIFPKVGAALLTNKRRILTKDSCVDNNIMTLTPIENKINPIFLYSLYLQIDFNDLSNDGALPSLNGSQVKKIMIPLPPLEEQKKIADILSTVDKKIAFVEENINVTEELKKGLMQKLLTEGIGHTEFKDSELGRIPESWEVVTLNNIISLLTDYHANGSYEKLKENVELLEEENYAVMIRTTNFENNNFENNLIYITEHAYNYLKKSKVNENDIVINKIANAGATYIMPKISKPVSLAMNLFLLKLIDTVDNKFIYLQIKKREENLKALASGTSTKTITKNDVKNFIIALAPIEEQKQIAEILSTVDNKLENLKEKKLFFQELKKGLMQKLLTGEVRI